MAIQSFVLLPASASFLSLHCYIDIEATGASDAGFGFFKKKKDLPHLENKLSTLIVCFVM
jgi:hypothetical protein